MHHFRPHITPYAFTLIEVMAVLVITAILAAVVGSSLSGAATSARLEDALASAEEFDRQTRDQARRFRQPFHMVFDFEGQSLQRLERGGTQSRAYQSSSASSPTSSVAMPKGYHIAQIMMASGQFTDGEVTVPCSSRGLTPSYAIQVEQEDSGRDSVSSVAPHSSWLLFAGLSGQTQRITDEQIVRNILAPLATAQSHDSR